MVCVYDSGVGGLSALLALRRAAPTTDVLYFGDTARVPYGTRDAATVRRYAREVLSYLAGESPSAVLVACGTVSTVFLPTAGEYPVRLFGVADAGVRAAVRATRTGRILVLGTEATVRSGYFARAIGSLLPGASVLSLACPLFVALAECGYTAPEDALAHLAAERLLAPARSHEPDTVVLGCTHFPFLAPQIAACFPSATLIDCGAAAVRELLSAVGGDGGSGRTEYRVTDGAGAFCRAAARMMGITVADTVREVSLPHSEV